MSLSINNNITALNAWRNVKGTDENLSRSMEKLSSGLRINRAADDPASLVISEKMRAQLAGIDAAVKNSEKAVNMIQTAEAALDKVGKLLVKLRQLALDTSNTGINDSAMLAANQSELDEAVASITRIANYTQFGTKKLLNGDMGASVTGTGAGLAAGATFDLASSTMAGHDGASVDLTVNTKATRGAVTLVLHSGGGAASNVTLEGQTFTFASNVSVTTFQGTLTGNAALAAKYTITTGAAGRIIFTNKDWGTEQSVASLTVATATGAIHGTSSSTAGVNLKATLIVDGATIGTMSLGAGLQLRDASGNVITVTSTAMNGATIGVSNTMGTIADNAATFQIGPNESQTITVGIQSAEASALGRSATYDDADGNYDQRVTAFVSLADLTSTSGVIVGGAFEGGSADELAQSIGVIDKAIDDVASLRGSLGAVQSDNLQVQLDSLRVSYENLQASESTIRDTDMTLEMAQFTKFQIMMQAGTAMLAQANQMPNNILQLLQ